MILTPPVPASSNRPRRKFTVDEYERMIDLGILNQGHRVELIRGVVVIKGVGKPYRFTVEEYEQLVKQGMLTEDDRAELIRGEIVTKMTINAPHASTVKRTHRVFARSFGDRVVLGSQDPVQLTDSVPEPDVSVLEFRADFYADAHPTADETLLLVEVADSSLDEDRNVKGPLYAQSRIREYWIVNLIDDCVEVYRSPRPDGTWGEQQTLRRNDQIEIQALPGTTISISDILPPAP